MNTLTQPLRDEHKELFPSVDRIRQVADLIGAHALGIRNIIALTGDPPMKVGLFILLALLISAGCATQPTIAPPEPAKFALAPHCRATSTMRICH